MAYDGHHSIRDGKIVLYRRNGKLIYHARMAVDGVDGYVVQSTRQTDLAEAIRVANERYEDYRYKVRNGLETSRFTFETIWRRWYQTHSQSEAVGEHRLRYIKGTATRYFLPFFGAKALADITDAEIAKYWDWRRVYWSSEEGAAKIEKAQKSRTTEKRPYKQKLGNVAKTPSAKSLKMEQTVLKQILHWAFQIGAISRMPFVKSPVKLKRVSETRRPAFTLEEWQQLYRFMRHWAEGKEADGSLTPDARLNSMHLWHRELIRNYVLIMGRTGLRPNEARQLRWCDLDQFKADDGEVYIVLNISPDTKTGERDVIGLGELMEVFDRIKEKTKFKGATDFVFAAPSGKPVDNFGKTFKSVLEICDLLKDRHGRIRTIYSLRHTYATLRLLHGDVPIDDLARNMGTSTSMIEKHYSHVTNRQKAKTLSGRNIISMSRKGLNW